MAAPLLEGAPSIAEPLIDRIAALDDDAFLLRLPALRDGFEVLSPAARERFLYALEPTVGSGADLRVEYPADTLARWADADHHGRQAVLSVFPDPVDWTDAS